MKVALCLFGMPPSKCNKHIKVKTDFSSYLWNKNVIIPNNVDVFIHCWGKEDEDGLRDAYNPKKSIFEDNIVFDKDHPVKYDYEDGGGTTLNMFLSQAYSAKKSIELKKQFEKENSFKYDLVMMSRIDCLWFINPDFENLNPEKFYVSNWNQTRAGRGRYGDKSNRTTVERNYRKILDYWFISNSEYIDKFSGLYDFIPKWVENLENSRCLKPKYRTPERQTELSRRYRGAGFSNHVLKKDFLVHLGIWDKVKFKFYEHYDHNVQRYFHLFGDDSEHKSLLNEIEKLKKDSE